MAQSDTAPEDRPSSAQNAVGDHATSRDSLGFAPYVEAVCAFLTSKQTSPPLTMSIEGEWGSGKSSFMLQLEVRITGPSWRDVFWSNAPRSWGGEKVDGSLLTAVQKAWQVRQPPVIRFNAWRHDKQDALWAAFALAVSRRLRQRIGSWRGLGADVRLFFLRLRGVRGWLELLLAAVSVFVLLFSLWTLRHDLLLGPQHLVNRFKSLGNEGVKLPSVYATLLLSGAAAHGSWLALMLVALAGLVKFWDQIKLPIAFDLKKYLSTPDYKGHSAFIESFHEDFARLIRAYAGDDRVYVFIDDLDRCDVPRAAELMQAINLMISDAGNLVFILGMDREKVAAGLTQKYKDLLPYLPEYAPATGGNPVAFGYSYLEKFIQLTFTLPVMAGEGALEQFLNALVPVPERLRWASRVDAYWRQRFKSKWNQVRPGSFQEPFQVDPAIPGLLENVVRSLANLDPDRYEAAQAQRRVERLRLTFEQDSAAVHDVVRMVSPLFGNNPRRLKQFLSTYRLALALTYSQGILASVPHEAGVTMHQLGKFVALLMKFPDLRGALASQPGLLGDLETSALEWPKSAVPDNPNLRWLQNRSVRDLLTYRVPVSHAASLYGGAADLQCSLLRLDVSRLMSLLPKAQPEPETADKPADSPVAKSRPEVMDGVAAEAPPASAARADVPPTETGPRVGDSDHTYLQLFQGLAAKYERLRQTMEASEERTKAMTALVEQVRSEARVLGVDGSELTLSELLKQNTDGTRIVALGLASSRIQQKNLEWLIGFLREYRSPFEHFWSIRALNLHKRFFNTGYASSVAEILHGLMPEIQKDPGRVDSAESLLAEAIAFAAGPESSSMVQGRQMP